MEKGHQYHIRKKTRNLILLIKASLFWIVRDRKEVFLPILKMMLKRRKNIIKSWTKLNRPAKNTLTGNIFNGCLLLNRKASLKGHSIRPSPSISLLNKWGKLFEFFCLIFFVSRWPKLCLPVAKFTKKLFLSTFGERGK